MGHYDTNETHTCDADEHDWEETMAQQSVQIVLRDGDPCFKLFWSTTYECTNRMERIVPPSGTKATVSCDATKRGRSDTVVIPLDKIEPLDSS